MSNNLNELAFPVSASYSDDSPQTMVPVGGLTKHEYAAILIAAHIAGNGKDPGDSYVADKAFKLAAEVLNKFK